MNVPRRGAGVRPSRSSRGAAPRSATRSYDVLVMGGGIAGLTAAVGAAHVACGSHHQGRPGRDRHLPGAGRDRGSHRATMTPRSSPQADTLEAGVGLCDERCGAHTGGGGARPRERTGDARDQVRSPGRQADPRLRRGPFRPARGAGRRRRHRQRGGERTMGGLASGSRVELHERRVRRRPAGGRRALRGRPLPRRRGRTHLNLPVPWCSPGGAGQVFATPPTRWWPPATGRPWPTGRERCCETWSSCSSIPPPSHGGEPHAAAHGGARAGRGPTCATTRGSGSWWAPILRPSWRRATWWCGT